MKISITKITIVIVVIAVGITLSCNNANVKTVSLSAQQGRFPADVLTSCQLVPGSFNSWFNSGTASENGMVNPANSVTFQPNDNCSFYRWSQQMFLWVTSTIDTGTSYKGKTVMESNMFYTVSPSSDSVRTLVPHSPNQLLRAMPRPIKQFGPHRLPVVMSKDGKMYEVENDVAKSQPKLKNDQGKIVELDHVETAPNGMHMFMDKVGKPISKPVPLFRTTGTKMLVHEFKTAKGNSVFVDTEGTEIETESGQATGDALIAINGGSLVYYISMVNDVYAWFRFGNQVNNNNLVFPTTDSQRNVISSLAKANGVTLPDSNALVVELKTSWVAASTLPDLGKSYITIKAVVPVYTTSNDTMKINVNDSAVITLALIGIHFVGSVHGHPELVWSTFEHINNTPNTAYSYLDSNNHVKRVAADTGNGWLLNNNTASDSVNYSHMGIAIPPDTATYIYARPGFQLNGSNTQKTKPFGVADTMNFAPNQQDTSSSASNSEIISINNQVNGLLVGNDVRKNYFLVGSTWTFGGTAPNGLSYNPATPDSNVAIGTSQLANSTMETYAQQGISYSKFGTCFACHSSGGTPSLNPNILSHIYSYIDSFPSPFQSSVFLKPKQ